MDTRAYDHHPGSIAIVGMAGRFPAADSVDELWRLLRDGREATRWLTDEELLAEGVSAAALRDPNYVKASLILPDMESFDAGFFGFSPREAAILDPQHRHFLECCWEALEDAGHVPDSFEGAIGVFGGCGMQAYFAYNLLNNAALLDSVGLFLMRHTGNDKDFLTTRVSYLLNLQGPSVAVQTACSTSLVATHMACQSLLAGECDMALAGGVSIEVPHRRGYRFAEGEVHSTDGHCRAFDDASSGTLFGSGAGVVVLRRLDDALASGDNIHGVIRGSAINNDGLGKAGYLAPSIDGQARAAAEALAVAGVDPSTIDYIEAHGTGTVVGDPIELTALTQAYGKGNDGPPLVVGSIKTNIGHLDTAAGVSSLIKVLLALKHEVIPASLNYAKPNTRFDFATSRFRVADRSAPWPRGPSTRRAGVNSLGVGGTNAHVIVEEAPKPRTAGENDGSWQIVTLSAKSSTALDGLKSKWADSLTTPGPDFTLANAAFTTQVGRKAFEHRFAAVAADAASLRAAIESNDLRRTAAAAAPQDTPDVVFMFPGGGVQYPGAAREHYDVQPVFRAAADACFRAMTADAPGDLRSLMFETASDDKAAAEILERPIHSLLAVFVVEYALAKLWESWGVKPAALIGHSAGEYAAAALAGVMSVEDALAIVTLRGEIFASVSGGAMLAANISESGLRALIGDELDLAVVNAPDLCVASGPTASIERLQERLSAQEIESSRVRINAPAHSRMLDPALPRFRERLQRISFSEPAIPFVSNLSGGLARPGEVASADYWVRHLREAVRFHDGLRALLDRPNRILLEVGPGQALSSLGRQCEGTHRALAVVSSTRKAQESDSDHAFLLTAAGRLWTRGVAIDFAPIRGNREVRRISLPTYAFEKNRHWIEADSVKTRAEIPATPSDPGRTHADGSLERIERIEDWFSVPAWVQTPLAPARANRTAKWLVFADEQPLSEALLARLAARGAMVSVVRFGEGLVQGQSGDFVIDPANPEHYRDVLASLDAAGNAPHHILHLWSLGATTEAAAPLPVSQRLAFDSAFFLAQALQLADAGTDLRLGIVTSGTQSVSGESVPNPHLATLLGACRVLPREMPNIFAELIDIDQRELEHDRVAGCLLDEFDAQARDPIVALRGGQRWAETLSPLKLAGTADLPRRLRAGGVYLITGGLGAIGLTVADYLAAAAKARLVLIGRNSLPPREDWSRLASIEPPTVESDRIKRLLALEAKGAEVLVVGADVTDLASMTGAIAATTARFGAVHGVFHAAGTVDDGPIAGKTIASAHAVLAPKLAGAQILNELLPPGTLDLFAVFSSTSALIGPPGQIDYVAANAVLDSLATARSDGLSIDWGVWSDIGMAARAVATSNAGQLQPLHPLLGACTLKSATKLQFEALYDARKLWVLAEHVVAGRPILPGTGYIEIARAAMDQLAPGAAIDITRLTLLEPLAFERNGQRTVRITLDKTKDGYDLVVESSLDAREPWLRHAEASVSASKRSSAEPTRAHVAALDVDLRSLDEADFIAQRDVVAFGPRWTCLENVSVGRTTCHASLALDSRFASDVATYRSHPALVDMAATIGLHLVDRSATPGAVFVPVTIDRVRLLANLPERLRCRARLVSEEKGRFASFDAELTDLDGRVLAIFEGFQLRCVTADAVAAAISARSDIRLTPLQRMIGAGIRSSDAGEILSRVLDQPARRVVVSSIALAELRQMYAAAAAPHQSVTKRSVQANTVTYANSVERTIAGYWSELLGIETIRPEDEFFALGGHSLAAVRLFAKIRKEYGLDFPLATLFHAPTVRSLAGVVADKAGIDLTAEMPAVDAIVANDTAPAVPRTGSAWSPLIRICTGNTQRLPLFCIHGAHGNVLNFKPISQLLGSDQPFYALQAQGVDGTLPPLDSIEDMAALYLQHVEKTVPTGPYVLAGYSGGGIVAIEMARRLALAGKPAALVVMFDTLSPSASQYHMSLIERLWEARHWSISHAIDWPRRKLAMLRERLMIRMAARQAQDQGVVTHELLSQRIWDAFIKAQSSYVAAPYGGDVALFRAKDAKIEFVRAGKRLGWDGILTGAFDIHEVTCSHDNMMQEPSISAIAGVLRRRLDALNTIDRDRAA